MGIVLTVDIGNTNIVVGLWDKDVLAGSERFVTRRDYSFDQVKELLVSKVRGILAADNKALEGLEFEGSILTSVVPQLNEHMIKALEMMTNEKPLLMGAFLCTGIDVSGYDKAAATGDTGSHESSEAATTDFRIKPGEARLGADRIVDLSAAHAMYPDRPVMVCDLGSCTTTSVIDAEGRFVGGMICAGLQMSLDAEAQRTSQLPQLEASGVTSLLGRDTASNMMSGAVAGTGLMISELYKRLKAGNELDSNLSSDNDAKDSKSWQNLKLVLTGGLGRLVLPWIEADVTYEPDLLMKGLYEIYRKNQ